LILLATAAPSSSAVIATVVVPDEVVSDSEDAVPGVKA
jgi:hypothetical protein